MDQVKKIGVANILTILRVVCIPVFIVFYALDMGKVALGVFVAASGTDLIDGTIARLRKENSTFGALLDPIADKGLMLAVFVALAVTRVVPWWFIWVILLRDAVVTSGYIYIKAKKIKFQIKSIFSSKVATLFEIIAGTLALIYNAFPNFTVWVYPVGDLVFGTVLITTILILVATMHYLKMGLDLVDKGHSKKAAVGNS
jgi:CDP-diacylglycerol--glycerol-3-phosphate 3-phosphatidyltransferase